MRETGNQSTDLSKQTPIDLPVDREGIFSNDKGIYVPGIEKRQNKLLDKISFLKPFLKEGEKIILVTTACSPMSFLEQFFSGWIVYYLKRSMLIMTNRRIFHVPARINYSYRNSIAQIHYSDCQTVVMKGSALIIGYKNKKKEKFYYVASKERKKIKSLLKTLSLEGEQSATGERSHLCPRCTVELTKGRYACPNCHLSFKEKEEGRKIATIYPGGGYFYTRHPILGVGDAITEVVLMIMVILSLVMAIRGVEGGFITLLFWTIALVFEKLISVYHSDQFIDEYIPKVKDLDVGAFGVSRDTTGKISVGEGKSAVGLIQKPFEISNMQVEKQQEAGRSGTDKATMNAPISIKAIIFGTSANIIAMLAGIMITVFFIAVVLGKGGIEDVAQRSAGSNILGFLTLKIMGFFAAILGGFIAGRVAKENETRHALITGAGIILLSWLYDVFSGRFAFERLTQYYVVFVNLPAAYLGGILARQTKRTVVIALSLFGLVFIAGMASMLSKSSVFMIADIIDLSIPLIIGVASMLFGFRLIGPKDGANPKYDALHTKWKRYLWKWGGAFMIVFAMYQITMKVFEGNTPDAMKQPSPTPRVSESVTKIPPPAAVITKEASLPTPKVPTSPVQMKSTASDAVKAQAPSAAKAPAPPREAGERTVKLVPPVQGEETPIAKGKKVRQEPVDTGKEKPALRRQGIETDVKTPMKARGAVSSPGKKEPRIPPLHKGSSAESEVIKNGRAKLNAGQFREAITLFDIAIEANPKDYLAYRLRGNAYDNLGDGRKAVEDWKAAAILGDKLIQSYLRHLNVQW
jgi:hypothetical protein